MYYPNIKTEICTGCRACMDVCPMGAIILKADKAFILHGRCSNCRVCETMCPVGAIS